MLVKAVLRRISHYSAWSKKMITENLTRPGEPLADGDRVRITYDNGSIVEHYYYAPVEPEPAPPQTYLHIDYPHTATINADITLTVSIKFEDGTLAPVNATYYVPIIRDADGRQEAFKEVVFVGGEAAVVFQVANPGVYIMRTNKIKPAPVSVVVDSPEIIVL
jgi:hypothetical protein